jgi:hypothetical protein
MSLFASSVVKRHRPGTMAERAVYIVHIVLQVGIVSAATDVRRLMLKVDVA